MATISVELNLTLRCNLRCANCNRCCNLFPQRTDDVSISQVTDFLSQLRHRNLRVKRIKVVGGEPLLHPEFPLVWDLLAMAVDDGLIQKVKVDTNGAVPIPKLAPHKGMRIGGCPPRKKRHIPYLWSPVDLGCTVSGNLCNMPYRCGMSLDNRGWLPCSPAIMIARGFGLEHLYRQEVPDATWGLKELCRHCIHAMPKAWKVEHCKGLGNITLDERQPSPSWREALERLGWSNASG